MRYLIISDLHSNLEALTTVLEAAQGSYERIVCCGDLVGYGADPNPVVNWVRDNVNHVIRGNHDKACCGLADPEEFSDAAKLAAYWTRDQLTPENLGFLKNLPQGPLDVEGQFAILHGSPRDEDEYLPSSWDASESFGLLQHRVSFFGHTHLQGGFISTENGLFNRVVDVPLEDVAAQKIPAVLEIRAAETYLLNPGSVGQPRDQDNRAAFAVFDTDGVVEYGRAAYNIETTMSKILSAGLPPFLAYRLTVGR